MNSYHGLGRVAKVALDSNATAYLLSTDGKVLFTVAAARCLWYGSTLEELLRERQKDLKLEYVTRDNVPCELLMDEEEECSPATTAPSPSVQYCSDEEAMEWVPRL